MVRQQERAEKVKRNDPFRLHFSFYLNWYLIPVSCRMSNSTISSSLCLLDRARRCGACVEFLSFFCFVIGISIYEEKCGDRKRGHEFLRKTTSSHPRLLRLLGAVMMARRKMTTNRRLPRKISPVSLGAKSKKARNKKQK